MIVINAITAIIGAEGSSLRCVGLFDALELACLATRSKPGYTRWLCPFWAELLSTFFRRVSAGEHVKRRSQLKRLRREQRSNNMSQSNSQGLLGRKVGMMRLFTDDGDAVPVTVVDVSNNRVTQVKTQENDGYVALQVTFGARKSSRVTKPQAGHLAKAGVQAGEIVQEFRVTPEAAAKYAAGAVIPVADVFSVGQKVDVQGTSIGKGFTGTIKRHNFSSQRASHGNSRSHNVPGSISMAQDPGRVFPGKKMSGHLGDVTKTIQNLDVIRIDEARQLLLIRGAVPGAKGGFVTVRPAVKAKSVEGAK
jgi:large subunit ribosomal protein L3